MGTAQLPRLVKYTPCELAWVGKLFLQLTEAQATPFPAGGALQGWSPEDPFASCQALQAGGLAATSTLLPPHPARAEPLCPWGQCRGRKGGPREGRSGWTASRHRHVWLSFHLLVGLTGEIVLFAHHLVFLKQKEKIKLKSSPVAAKGYRAFRAVMAGRCQQGTETCGN